MQQPDRSEMKMRFPKLHAVIYVRGFLAGASGEPVSANPHKHPAARAEWVAGYRRAQASA
jgi:ribosome modulation factor